MVGKIKEIVLNPFRSEKNVSTIQMSLTLLQVICLILSNIIVVKSIDLFGIPQLANTAAAITFPVTYVLSDVFSEVYGYKWSRTSSIWAMIGTAICSILFSVTIALPGNAAWTNQDALVTILGNTPQIAFASILAFGLGDWADDIVFKKLKKADRKGKFFPVRAILSSLAGKYVDGLIFTFVGLSFLPLETKIIMVLNCPFVQVAIETVLVPFTSVIAKKLKKIESKVNPGFVAE